MVRWRLAIATLLLVSATSAYADDDNFSVVTAKGTTSYDISAVSRIDFSDDGLTILSEGKDGVTYAFDEIKKIVFSQTTAGVEPMAISRKGKLTLTVANGGGTVTVNGWGSRGKVPLAIYDTAGNKACEIGTWDGESIDVSALPHGIYILKIGEDTAKFRK